MDATQAIILITLVNTIISGLVGGIVIYVIQKKIDATIQKSLFEHETKFAQLHAKRVEALENLYQRFLLFADAIRQWLVEIMFSDLGELDPEIAVKQEEKVWEKITNFYDYFNANRLFLPEGLADQVLKIYRKGVALHNLVNIVSSPRYRKIAPHAELVEDIVMDFEGDMNTENLELLSRQVSNVLEILTKRLEQFYKSVADTQ